MTTKDKRLIAVFSAVLLVLAGCILLRYYKHVSNYYAAVENSRSIEDPAYLTGYHYTTKSSQLTKTENPDGITSRKTFIHEVYAQDDQNLVTITVTITGNNSSENSTISHISTSLSEERLDSLNISEHLSGETATVILYVNQISVCHFQYRLSSDGSIYSL